MSSIPSGLGRIPDLLRSQVSLANLTRTNLELFRMTTQLSTGRAINRPSDDSVKAATIIELNERLARASQLGRNLDAADSTLSSMDAALGEATDLILQAKSIASSQLNIGSSAEERAGQAVVIDSIIQGLYQIVNRETTLGHIFGGSEPGQQPMETFLGGYRYLARGRGISTDLDIGGFLPVTLGGTTVLGSPSARVKGTVDLDPALTTGTLLNDLDGARGLGVSLGEITFSYDGGTAQSVDLTGAGTVEDVIARLTAAIRAYEEDADVAILGDNGIGVEGESITIDIADEGGAGATLVFNDVGTGTAALDLGLNDADGTTEFSAASDAGLGVGPRLTWLTPVAALDGLEGQTLGQLQLRAHGVTRVVDLSEAETLEDISNLIEASGLGVRVEINDQGSGINVLNEVAGALDSAMAIEEIEDGGETATLLGIRSLSADTLLADFNDGRGVGIVSGAVDPDTGDPDPERDIDFTVMLGNGVALDINLSPQHMTNVGTLLDAINFQAELQLSDLGLPTTLFQAELSETTNGIVFRQDTDYPGVDDAMVIEPRNNSPAAWQLGLMEGEMSDDASTLTSEDRAKVRPANLFSYLIDLRDSLANNDTSGITLAGENLESSVDRFAQTRALVGGYATRVSRERQALEDRDVLDRTVLSQVQDADFAQVASRIALLQTQLQAGLQTAAATASLSLLDFLG